MSLCGTEFDPRPGLVMIGSEMMGKWPHLTLLRHDHPGMGWWATVGVPGLWALLPRTNLCLGDWGGGNRLCDRRKPVVSCGPNLAFPCPANLNKFDFSTKHSFIFFSP